MHVPVTVANSLISMYAKCGDLQKAKEISQTYTNHITFDNFNIFLTYKPLLQNGLNATIMWTAIIQAHITHGQAQEALKLFYQMQKAGVTPEEHTYSSILSIIADLSDMHKGQNIHAQIMVS